MNRIGGPLGAWRLGVVTLAACVWLHQFTQVDLADFGWQFRYASIWALTLSLISGALVFQAGLDRDVPPPRTLIAVTAGANAVAVILYWRMHLTDPLTVSTDPLIPWQFWYLYAAGPALQWVEAIFLTRAFGRPVAPALWLCGLVAIYVAWIEGAVSPLNEVPGGAVTTGLPYPFLNDMTAPDRLGFYAGAALIGMVAIGSLALAQRMWRRPPPAASIGI